MSYQVGSSPHTRGARRRRARCRSRCRDHPRIRGEHDGGITVAYADEGSSPHTRGARAQGAVQRARQGIIPAYAGSTAASPASTSPGRDHPRIRGEHSSFILRTSLSSGSSPHTRGARCRGNLRCARAGIIPAYAGSTRQRQQRGCSSRDHPRIRGEHSGARTRKYITPGSSPHTRGAPPRGHGGRLQAGIIPAYAGSTRTRTRSTSKRRDHPRIRGEHCEPALAACDAMGSSPHTRGALVGGQRIVKFVGIIPAYAGSTHPSRHR